MSVAPTSSFKHLFKVALKLNRDKLWMTPHSHGLLPDAYVAAQMYTAHDVLALADGKWKRVFQEIIPEAQGRLARLLGSSRPRDIAFAPNTHQFVTQLLSNHWGQPCRILTTDQEFHSASRQFERLKEISGVEVNRVSVEPFATFNQRLQEEVRGYDVVYFSHVFFNSGHVVQNLRDLVLGMGSYCGRIVIDGYHAVGAFPVDDVLKDILDRVYYIGGGYKYLMAGEGACFMSLPANCEDRPVVTGWMADFGSLEHAVTSPVPYVSGGFRYFGGTFDPMSLYRFNEVWRYLEVDDISVETIHAHVVRLQDYFLEGLDSLARRDFGRAHLTHGLREPRANFLCFDLQNAEDITNQLEARRVHVDRRGTRLRIGFGLYHDEADIDRFLNILAQVVPRYSCP